MSERLIPVRDVGELRVGMIVVRKGCARCGDTHREMILRLRHREGVGMSGRPSWLAGDIVPDPHNQPISYDLTILDGRLFRVDDAVESSTTTTRQRQAVRP